MTARAPVAKNLNALKLWIKHVGITTKNPAKLNHYLILANLSPNCSDENWTNLIDMITLATDTAKQPTQFATIVIILWALP